MLLNTYLHRSFGLMILRIAGSLTLLSTTHALLYAFKKMEGVQIPLDFFVLFFSKDIFRSLPFILNFSFGLALVIWQHQLRVKKYDITTLVCGYPGSALRWIFTHYAAVVVTINILCLFFIHPSMNYKIETELYPKILHNTMIALPPDTAFKIDDSHIFYFNKHISTTQGASRVFEGVKILNVDVDHRPLLVVANSASFYNDSNTLFLKEGALFSLGQEDKHSGAMNFKVLEYKILPSKYHITHHSLSLRQLVDDFTSENSGHLFLKCFLSVMPLLLFFVLSNQTINIKFSGVINFEIALVTAYYLLTIIIGIIISKSLQSENSITAMILLACLACCSLFFRRIYAHVFK